MPFSKSMPLGLKIAIIDRAFKRKMDARAAEMQLTAVQFRVLGEISLLEQSQTDEINQKDLENLEQISHPAMTGIIQRLESKGFIHCEPSTKDKRYKKITCRKDLCGIHQEIEAQDKAVFEELCTGLSPDQKNSLLDNLNALLQNI